jgi:hypothetical protein
LYKRAVKGLMIVEGSTSFEWSFSLIDLAILSSLQYNIDYDVVSNLNIHESWIHHDHYYGYSINSCTNFTAIYKMKIEVTQAPMYKMKMKMKIERPVIENWGRFLNHLDIFLIIYKMKIEVTQAPMYKN